MKDELLIQGLQCLLLHTKVGLILVGGWYDHHAVALCNHDHLDLLEKPDVPVTESFFWFSRCFHTIVLLQHCRNILVVNGRKEVAILLGKYTYRVKVVTEEISHNHKANEGLLGNPHEIHQGASMEIGSGLRSEKGNTALFGNKEATKGGPVLEHKTPKNVLEDIMLVRRRGETETRCNKNWHEGLGLGTTWQVRVREVLSIIPFQKISGDLIIINLKVGKELKIENRKSRVKPLKHIFCRNQIKQAKRTIMNKTRGKMQKE
jgi:hypothetical protein